VLAITACERAIPPTSVAGGQRDRVSFLVADPDNAPWNTFDADVNVAFDGGGSGIHTQKITRGFGYHIHRSRDQSGRWFTDLSAGGDYLPRVVGAEVGQQPPRIVRSVGFSRTTAPVFYNAMGARVAAKDLTVKPRPVPAGVGPRQAPAPPDLAGGPSNETRNLAPIDTARDWIDRFMVTAAGGARTRARLQQIAGTARPIGTSRSLYSITRGGLGVEIVVNDVTNLVEEVRATDRGRLRTRTTREYELQSNGLFVLRSERITRFAENEKRLPLTVEMIYRNIRLSQEP